MLNVSVIVLLLALHLLLNNLNSGLRDRLKAHTPSYLWVVIMHMTNVRHEQRR